MIYYNKNNSDETKNILEEEKLFLESRKNSQINYKNIILQYINNYIDFNSVDINSTSCVLEFLENLKDSLNYCTTNISNIETIISNFDKVTLSIKNNDINIEDEISNFNKLYSELNKKIIEYTLKIEKCILSIAEKSELKFSNTIIEKENEEKTIKIAENNNQTADNNSNANSNSNKKEKSKKEKHKKQNHKKGENLEDINNVYPKIPREYKENTLIISEACEKVFLPYFLSDLKEILKDNPKKYSSIDDVIDKKYTISISHFKNPFVARFKEAFKLMRNKEKSSVIDAFELGTELMFENNLYPAIITACKNLDELDIYLDYLDNGETDKFKCFNIDFELPPALIK